MIKLRCEFFGCDRIGDFYTCYSEKGAIRVRSWCMIHGCGRDCCLGLKEPPHWLAEGF